MMNQSKKGLWVGFAGCGMLALALAAAPARAADPMGAGAAGTVTETGGSLPTRTETVHATASVTAIDKGARKLTIKRPDGEKKVIQVPEEVKAFDRLKVGDKIDIDYSESVVLGMLPPGTKPSATERSAAIPGAAGREMTISAEVVSVDAANNKVTVKGPAGGLRTLSVQDPNLQSRLPNLKPGQVLVLQYTEAVAASIQPPAK